MCAGGRSRFLRPPGADAGEILPWSMVDISVHTDCLWREREQAYRSVIRRTAGYSVWGAEPTACCPTVSVTRTGGRSRKWRSLKPLLFSKNGRACYISHLDLMATFQRVFLRAGVPIWQTQGFNKHAYVSIALPLSVGYSSDCEILEFNLDEGMGMDLVPAHMNAACRRDSRLSVLRHRNAAEKDWRRSTGPLQWSMTAAFRLPP